MISSAASSPIKCDYLDVTFSPDDAPIDEIRSFLDSAGCEVVSRIGDDRQTWRVGSGVLVLEQRARFARASASGGALDHLRDAGLFYSYLAMLAQQPHSVTRLDACLDSESPGHVTVSDLWRRYPRNCSLTRKALSTKVFLGTDPEGNATGSFYVGHRSAARVTARVYDKRQQLIDVYGTDPGRPWTRYELTVRKDVGATLRDAAQPERLFWHFMAPPLLSRPGGVSDWSPNWGTGWEYRPPDVVPYERLKRRVAASGEIARLLELADAVGPNGREWLLSLLARRLGVVRSA